jgi:hypothetical protein
MDGGMTEQEALERWPDLEPEDRERRRKLSNKAKERHAQVADPQTGRRVFGGPQPGSGRPRKKRVAEAVAEKATEEQERVVNALFSGLKKSNDPKVRVATAEKIIKIEHKERELQLHEDSFQGKSEEDFREWLEDRLVGLSLAGDLPTPGESSAPRQQYDAEGSVAEES